MAEACFLFGWSPNDALKTPAARFFRLLSAGRKLKRVQTLSFLYELSDLAVLPMTNADYVAKVRSSLRDKLLMEMDLNPVDPEPIIKAGLDGEDARSALFAIVGSMRG